MPQPNIDIRRVNPQADSTVLQQIDCLGIFGQPSERIQENRMHAHEASPNARRLIFHQPESILPDEDIMELGRHGLGGFTMRDNHFHAAGYVMPLACRDFRFLRCRGKKWEMASGGNGLFQPFIEDEDSIVLPLMGGIHVNGEDITQDPEKMRKLGFEIIREPDGSEATHPGFSVGGRSLLLPAKIKIPAFKTHDGGWACVGLDRLKGIVKINSGPGAAQQFEQAIEQHMRAAWQQDNEGLDWDTYRRRRIETSMFKSVVSALSSEPNAPAKMFEGIAVQFKGVGVMKYVYHANRQNDDGTVDLQLGDVILETGDAREQRVTSDKGVAFCQRPEYAGKSGILLDVHHEFFDKSPTGGIYSEEKGIERDHNLWAEGAEMSGILMGYVPFLSKVDVDAACGGPTRMVCEQTIMAVRVILDHTLRLKSLCRGGSPGQPTHEFKEFIKQENVIASGDPNADYSEEGKGLYLARLNRTVGKNLGICLGQGLTVMMEQDTEDNMSVYGGIIDSQSFIDVKNRYQCRPLVVKWLGNMTGIAASAGMSEDEYYSGRHFEELAEGMLGAATARAVVERVRSPRGRLARISTEARASIELTKAFVRKQMREDGKQVPESYLIGRLERDRQLQRIAGIGGLRARDMKRELDAHGRIRIQYEGLPGIMGQKEFTREQLHRLLEDALIEEEILLDEPRMKYNLDQSLRPDREIIPEEDISRGGGGASSGRRDKPKKKKKPKRRRR
ncbi:MAG: hypothetical protein ABIH11_06850 [Candidatus Altiarchaeota archaeon]